MTKTLLYYNNTIQGITQVNDKKQFSLEEDLIINEQALVQWEHFIRGRLTSTFHQPITKYYRINKLGKRFTFTYW